MRFLHPEDHVFDQMLTGWRNQQLSRNLAHGTIESRERLVTRFQASTNEYPWLWTPAHADEFFGDLRSVRHAAQSTIRSYQAALRAFCGYVASPEYCWDRVCEEYFGTHPVQVCFDWNTAALFKVAYCWGLRRNEVRHLQTVDFARNPHAREFGKYGVL